MSYTKRQLVIEALTEIGLSSYSFDLSTDQIEQAIKRLDSMVASWGARGIRLGFPLPGSPEEADANTETNLPDWAWEAVITNLAVRIAPAYGKTVGPDTKATARESYHTLLGRFAMPDEMQTGALPAGAGHKSIDAPFLDAPIESIGAGPDATIDF
jgi:hypothetical protein